MITVFLSSLVTLGCVSERTDLNVGSEHEAHAADPNAAYELAELYAFGNGVEYEPALAFKNYLLAAEHGHAEAQFKLANRYDTGVGVHRSKLESLTWYLIAMDNPALSSRSRYWAGVYVRTFHSISAMQSDSSRALLEKAEQRAANWKPKGQG